MDRFREKINRKYNLNLGEHYSALASFHHAFIMFMLEAKSLVGSHV